MDMESNGPRERIMPATQLRVRLGEALRMLDDEDIIVEKGGVPIALLTRYTRRPGEAARGEDAMPVTTTAYAAALLKAGTRGGVARAVAAMERGIPGWDADALIADVRAARAAGTKTTSYSLTDDDEEDADDDLPARQRHRYRRPEAESPRVAEERGEWNADGGGGDQRSDVR
jgi:hypothetical protein